MNAVMIAIDSLHKCSASEVQDSSRAAILEWEGNEKGSCTILRTKLLKAHSQHKDKLRKLC